MRALQVAGNPPAACSVDVLVNASETSVEVFMAPTAYLTVSVRERRLLKPALDRAFDEVRSSLVGADRGIVVTRDSVADFMVALSSEVPYGLTMEVDAS